MKKLSFLLSVLLHTQLLQADSTGHWIFWGLPNHGLAELPESIADARQVAAGGNHALLLTAGGEVRAWGENLSGQTDVPADLSGVTAISAGNSHSLALLEDSSVRAWGSNFYGEGAVPPGLQARAIAAGGSFSAAIDLDGALVVWGFIPGGVMPVPAEFTNLVSIVAGSLHILAQRADGAVLAWSGAVLPTQATNVVALAAGDAHGSMALRADGTVVEWGMANPGQVLDLEKVVAISAGGNRRIAVLQDGSVAEWGELAGSGMPAGLAKVTKIETGGTFVLALGALRPHITAQPAGVQVFSGTPATLEIAATGTPPLRFQWQHNGAEIFGATNSTLLIPEAQADHAGAYRVVVMNDHGETGGEEIMLTVTDAPPRVMEVTTPVLSYRGAATVLAPAYEGSMPMMFQWMKEGTNIPGATGARLDLGPVPADAAGNYTVSVSNAFGSHSSGEITVQMLPFAWWGGNSPLLQMPLALTNAAAISARDWAGATATGVAVLSDGRVASWGNALVRQAPVSLTNAVAVRAGDGFCMALRANGTVAVWGANRDGQTNIPPALEEVVSIAAGKSHCLVLKANGTVLGWGGGMLWSARLKPPPDLKEVVAIDAGFLHSVALRRDGTVVSWGDNPVGQTNAPAGLSNVVAIAAGGDHTLALRRDGSVAAWGRNSDGQSEVPAGLDNVMAIAAADAYSMALRGDGSVVIWGRPGAVENLPPGLAGVQSILASPRIAYAMLGEGTPSWFVRGSDPALADMTFSVVVDGQRGSGYRLEFTDSLPTDAWLLGPPFSGENAQTIIRDKTVTTPARFYQIRRIR
jgi:alpha-tubulin suppressor-like RCC1 family protein